MSMTDSLTDSPETVTSAELGADTAPRAGRVLLVWDAPNLDMWLGSILGGILIVALGYRPVFAISLLVTACGALYLCLAVHEPRSLRNATEKP